MIGSDIDQELIRQGRALGDPTRHRIFRYVADASRPVGVAELTADVGLNHNAVRQHLALLRDAGLVTEAVEARDRPGRPRLMYRTAPEVEGSWGTTGPMEFLASALAEAIATGSSPYEVGLRLGRERARELLPALECTDRAEVMEEEMNRCGFRPTLRQRGGELEFSLHRCPFAAIATRSPEVVCQLHRGLVDGLSEGLGHVEVARFAPGGGAGPACRVTTKTT